MRINDEEVKSERASVRHNGGVIEWVTLCPKGRDAQSIVYALADVVELVNRVKVGSRTELKAMEWGVWNESQMDEVNRRVRRAQQALATKPVKEFTNARKTLTVAAREGRLVTFLGDEDWLVRSSGQKLNEVVTNLVIAAVGGNHDQ